MVEEVKTLSPADRIAKRLKQEMLKQGVGSADLAARADVKTSFLYDIMSGKSTNPSTIKLSRVADALGVSLTYLAGNTDSPAVERSADAETAVDYAIIPRLDVEMSAGFNVVVSRQHPAEHYYFRREWIRDHLGASPSSLRMFHIRGDSMEPTLRHHDLVLVDMTKKLPSPPGIFVLYDGFGLTAKRLEYVGDPASRKIRIISDNPQYAAHERIVEENMIIGRVVWFAREI